MSGLRNLEKHASFNTTLDDVANENEPDGFDPEGVIYSESVHAFAQQSR